MRTLRRITKCALLFLFCGLMSGCVNDDYDFDDDIDSTMGIGANGLTLKLGNTEKMYLRDLLKVEDSEMLDTMTTDDEQCLYYLVKDGSSSFQVKVNDIAPFKVDNAVVATTPVATNTTGVDIALNSGIKYTAGVSGNTSVKIDINDIPNEIEEVSKIKMENTSILITYSLSNDAFSLTAAEGFKITFPDDIVIKNAAGEDSRVYQVGNLSGQVEVPISYIQLKKNGTGAKFGQTVTNGKINLSEEVKVEGNFTVQGKDGHSFKKGESVKLDINLSFPTIQPKEVSGLVNPSINANVEPIQIGDGLPDFLQDDAVELHVSNPTLSFKVLGTQVPIPLLFYADLSSVKDGKTLAEVRVPESPSEALILSHDTTLVYFCTIGFPFKPEEDVSFHSYAIKDLGNLITKIPDRINVDLSTGHIKTNQEVEHTITLGKTYAADVTYEALIPFEFKANTQIVYTDSCDNMNKDLKDYQADGVTITASAENTVPLDLTVELIPKDVNGQVISGIEIGSAIAKAGSKDNPITTPLSITLKAKNPADVSKLDKIEFKIYCKSVGDGELYSNQYIQMKEIRVKLNGQIVGDFN